MVILQVMGPVAFMFDVSDTEPLDGAPPLPPEVERPFDVHGTPTGNLFSQTHANARRDSMAIYEQDAGSQSAGFIKIAKMTAMRLYSTRTIPKKHNMLP